MSLSKDVKRARERIVSYGLQQLVPKLVMDESTVYCDVFCEEKLIHLTIAYISLLDYPCSCTALAMCDNDAKANDTLSALNEEFEETAPFLYVLREICHALKLQDVANMLQEPEDSEGASDGEGGSFGEQSEDDDDDGLESADEEDFLDMANDSAAQQQEASVRSTQVASLKAGWPGMSGNPPWHGMSGVRRIQSEFKYLNGLMQKGQLHQVADLQLLGDDICKWRLKAKNFDDDVPGGRQLNADLRRLQQETGQDHLLLELSFPTDYPTRPFFLRVISPRCMWYTGHVTAGGAVCIEALTLSGTPGSWTSQYCVEAILTVVFTNFIDCEVYHVRTASGPGGLTGPLRVDLDHHYSHDVMMEYSWHEAQAAFSRMEQHHRANGWGAPQAAKPQQAPKPAKAAAPAAAPAAAAAPVVAAAEPGADAPELSPSRGKRRADKSEGVSTRLRKALLGQ